MNRDVAAGLGLLALAGLYLAGTLQIQGSSLSDEIGADGVPLILAGLLTVLSVLLAVRGWLSGRTGRRASPPGEEGAPLRRVLGFLGVAALYGPVAHALGYVGGLIFLIAAVALYEGARPSWRLAAVALGGAALFWLMFVQLLGVAQPHGVLF